MVSFFERWEKMIKSLPIQHVENSAPLRQSFFAELLYHRWNMESDEVKFAEENTQVIQAFMDDAEELLAELDAFDASRPETDR